MVIQVGGKEKLESQCKEKFHMILGFILSFNGNSCYLYPTICMQSFYFPVNRIYAWKEPIFLKNHKRGQGYNPCRSHA